MGKDFDWGGCGSMKNISSFASEFDPQPFYHEDEVSDSDHEPHSYKHSAELLRARPGVNCSLCC